MFFHPSPGGTLVSQDLCILFNGAMTGSSMSEASSVFATKRSVMIVTHSVIDWSVGVFSRIRVDGPGVEAFENGWRHYLSSGDVTADLVESSLRAQLPPENVIEISSLKKYKVRVGALNNGFYFKRSGAWFWDGFALRSNEIARTLQTFLEPKA